MESPTLPSALIVVVEQMHPRVVYAMETVLGEFLGLQLTLALSAPDIPAVPVFHYTRQPIANGLRLPCCNLLFEDFIRQPIEQIDWFGTISPELASVGMAKEDRIAQIFHALTQYDLLRPGARIDLDAHGRIPDGDGAYNVHEWLKELREDLMPHLTIPARPFSWEITIDVDQPWKYLHKPWHVRWGGLVRDLVRRKPVGERLRALRTRKDPYDVLPLIQQNCPPAQTSVFFLVDGGHSHDSRFSISQAAYQDYVRRYQAAGYHVGCHPSYESSTYEPLIELQVAALQRVTGSASRSRQHFLRFKVPATFRALLDAGITRDYSLCRREGTGPLSGVAMPYRWFDLQRNVATRLTLVPAVAMDRSLQQYMGLSPEQAISEIAAQIAKVRAVGGHFVIIFHNETWSESGEWAGWRQVIDATMRLLSS